MVDSVLSQLGAKRSTAIRAYRRFVSARRGEPVWESLKGRFFYGGGEFIEERIPEGSHAFHEIPREQHLVNRPPIEDIFGTTSEERAIATAYREYGYRLREIADLLAVHYSAVSRRLKKHEGDDRS